VEAVAMTLEQASRLAEEAHAGQVDRAGRPYTEHVFAVRDLLTDPDGREVDLRVV
jgi:(p)ppGpp synthase/HD superfamily hydrolase